MRLFAAIGIALMLASCASGGGRPNDRERFQRIAGKAAANPSEVVKAELSFARLAREKGQWTAFRETAADDAVMFVPNLTNAQTWLKNKADPAEAVDWQPHKITMSCDGTMAVSTGAWQDAKGGTGRFITIWQKQNAEVRRRLGKETDWKWVFDHGLSVDTPLPEPDFVETKVASCEGEPAKGAAAGYLGASNDGTFRWTANDGSQNVRNLSIMLWNGTGFDSVIDEKYSTEK